MANPVERSGNQTPPFQSSMQSQETPSMPSSQRDSEPTSPETPYATLERRCHYLEKQNDNLSTTLSTLTKQSKQSAKQIKHLMKINKLLQAQIKETTDANKSNENAPSNTDNSNENTPSNTDNSKRIRSLQNRCKFLEGKIEGLERENKNLRNIAKESNLAFDLLEKRIERRKKDHHSD
jgi:chromosome segregation ATPase